MGRAKDISEGDQDSINLFFGMDQRRTKGVADGLIHEIGLGLMCDGFVVKKAYKADDGLWSDQVGFRLGDVLQMPDG